MTENKKKNYVVIKQKMNYIKLKYNNLNYFNFQYGFRQLLTLLYLRIPTYIIIDYKLKRIWDISLCFK